MTEELGDWETAGREKCGNYNNIESRITNLVNDDTKGQWVWDYFELGICGGLVSVDSRGWNLIENGRSGIIC